MIQEVKNNPLEGAIQVPIKMNDPRWPSSQGWVKMQRFKDGPNNERMTIHFNYNAKTGVFDDFKIK